MGDGISLVGFSEESRARIMSMDVEGLFAKFVQDNGVRHAQYVSFGNAWLPKPLMVGATLHDYMEKYMARTEMSPIVEKMNKADIFVTWDDEPGLTEAQRTWLEDLRSHLGRNAMSIRLAPRPHAVGFTVTSDEPDDEWKARSAEILWNGLLFGEKIHKMVLQVHKAAGDKVWLSEFQSAYLASIASGMSVKSIADTYSVSEKAVLKHLDKAQKKLRAHNHTHAVAKAIVLGLIAA